MRQGQQNRRGRGRGNQRKSQNPLTRSFESAGPDVKIRGTPAHIAEKYISLARDANISGDPVLAENFLQHAEHYNRIIFLAREQQISQGGEGANGGVGRPHQFAAQGSAEFGEDFGIDDAGDDVQPPHPALRQQGSEPQPRAEGHRGGQEQSRFRGRSDRHDRGGGRGGGRGFRSSAATTGGDGDGQPPAAEGQSSRGESFAESHEQPEFLRRPVRRPRRDSNGGSTEANGGAVTDDADQD
jgi:hypothetical protein